jgi:hypothetical protein
MVATGSCIRAAPATVAKFNPRVVLVVLNACSSVLSVALSPRNYPVTARVEVQCSYISSFNSSASSTSPSSGNLFSDHFGNCNVGVILDEK